MEQLVNTLKAGINQHKNQINSISSPLFSEVMLPTSGCPHCLKSGVLGGCCFCDYISDHIEGLAMINVLRQKDRDTYIDLMKCAVEVSRGKKIAPSVSEVLTAYDTLNIQEVPDELCEALFTSLPYQNKPFQIELETRASSVTAQRLLFWKKRLPVRRVIIRMGVEIGDDWVRNHWLNKNISNTQIQKAVEAIHQVGWKANANLILGLPGLTEEQSIALFIEGVLWAEAVGFDTIVFSYLNHVPYSLQNYLYTQMKDNIPLKEAGIYRQEHTCQLSFYSLFYVFEQVIEKKPEMISKIGFSVFNPFTGNQALCDTYRKMGVLDMVQTGVRLLLEFNQKRDKQILLDFKKHLETSELYALYRQTIEEQKGAGSLIQTLKTVAEQLAKQLWPDQAQNKFAMFEDELKDYPAYGMREQ